MKNALFSALSILALTTTAQTFAQSAPDRDGFRTAIQDCAAQNKITLPERDRGGEGPGPSESDRQVIDACLQAKGISPPPPHGRGGLHGRRQQNLPPSSEDSNSVVSK